MFPIRQIISYPLWVGTGFVTGNIWEGNQRSHTGNLGDGVGDVVALMTCGTLTGGAMIITEALSLNLFLGPYPLMAKAGLMSFGYLINYLPF